MAGSGEGIPEDVKPAGTGEQLVGLFADLQEFNEMPELRRVTRSDVGCLTYKVLRVRHSTHPAIDSLITEARKTEKKRE